MRPSTVHIWIGDILLDGIEVADPDAFRAALAATLTELAAGHRGEYPSGAASALVGPPIVGPAPRSPAEVGSDVARAVWGSMIPAGEGRAGR